MWKRCGNGTLFSPVIWAPYGSAIFHFLEADLVYNSALSSESARGAGPLVGDLVRRQGVCGCAGVEVGGIEIEAIKKVTGHDVLGGRPICPICPRYSISRPGYVRRGVPSTKTGIRIGSRPLVAWICHRIKG